MIKDLSILVSHDTETGKYYLRFSSTDKTEQTITTTLKRVMHNKIYDLMVECL